jgi:hypothetical protein
VILRQFIVSSQKSDTKAVYCEFTEE